MIFKKNNFVALTIGLIISLMILEILLRIYPISLLNDNIFYRYDKDVGWMPKPNQKGKYYSNCFQISPIYTNSNGFRDKEWVNNNEFKICILGDSYMQGTELPEGNYLATILEKILDIQTLNGGINNYGTINEYLVFNKYIRQYKPDLVILFFYTMNDIVENCHALRTRLEGVDIWPTASINDQNNIVINYPNIDNDYTLIDSIRSYVKRHFKTILLFRRLYDYFLSLKIDHGRYVYRFGFYDVYMPEDKDWQDGWKLTEYFLTKIKNEVEGYGGELLLVLLPEYIKQSRTWRDDLRQFTNLKEVPPQFDLQRPVIKLREITKNNGIKFYELEPHFIKYRDFFDIKPPYFAYRCDGHLNPLGHFLAANLVTRYLIENNLVKLDDINKANISTFVEKNLHLSPIAILSPEGYEQIYNRGIFKGKTNILKIIDKSK